jgi:hypothetical protein
MLNIFEYMPKATKQFTYLNVRGKKEVLDFIQTKPPADKTSKSSTL